MKTIKVIAAVVIVILILPLLGYTLWLMKKGNPLDVVVVNKSLTKFNGSENKSMNYVLNSMKVKTVGNRTYKLDVDHIGLVWNKGDYRINYPRLKDVERTAEKTNLVYYADVKGIMTSQLKSYRPDQVNKLEYGGLNNTDYIFIKEIISLEKPLIVECNFIGPPTEPLVRYNMEKLLDIYYVGWIGKYISNLSSNESSEDQYDWKKLYEEYKDTSFSFSGPGIVFINTEAKRIVVLEEETHLHTTDGFIKSGAEAMNTYNIASTTNYYGWFTVLHPGRNEVLSEFILDPTEEGKILLNEAGIPENFPALIRSDRNCYFMAGDFGKSNVRLMYSKVAVLRPIMDAIRRKSKSPSTFFYSYYQPFMSKIVDDAIDLSKAQ